ncbi:MAG: nicotinate (nicotinamide) nucleotide adenylyltransferase [Acidobacteria bacterium]|nr:nicotinate (nicotinamide) nucleotide adenylyltransferase [Acidobacteriota bacterium]
MTPRLVGLLGGTFDPIHIGHLKAARAALDVLGLSEVLLIPAHHPPHRDTEPVASPYHRFAMVALAVSETPGLVASDLDMGTAGPSYTSTTLRRLHSLGLSALQIFFITGLDAFAEIATWKDYPGLFDLSHFVVVDRPEVDALSPEAFAGRFPALAHRVWPLGNAPGVEGAIRRPVPDLANAEHPWVFRLAADTPNVSATEIRRRLSAGDRIDGLVPEAVARHIARHGLYQAAE